MIFTLTDEHVKRMAAAAINASKAVGMGFLHLNKGNVFTVDDIHIIPSEDSLSIDYCEGRMVKFHARRAGEGKWNFFPDTPTADYQSWVSKYPTWEKLFEATNT